MSTSAEANKRQFNEQAIVFANWASTRNPVYMKELSELIGLSPTDNLLDVACGPGNFVAFASKKVKAATGIDISSRQVDIARKQAEELGLVNVNFICGNVEALPLGDDSFSVVTSKSAFHHFGTPEAVFKEMYRVCKPGGVICIDDITTYEVPKATQVIDQMDRLMDASHNRRMSPEEIKQLFLDKEMRVIKTKVSEFELTVQEYQSHALQTPANAKMVDKLINNTIQGGTIPNYLFRKDGKIMFINRGFTIVGEKPK